MKLKLLFAAVMLLMPGAAFAQYLGPISAPCVVQTNLSCTPVSAANPLVMIGKQESFQLVSANVPAAAVTVAGGDYILSQTCTSYGTLNLQVLGPDGVTWLTSLSKTSSDTTTGSAFSLGSFASIRVTVSGTTGCNAVVARVPA